MKASPVTRMGWHEYYVDLFNKTDGKRGEHLANWFLLLHLAFDEQPVEVPKRTRKDKARAFWNTVRISRHINERREAAKGLCALKRSSKVSWATLGLPDYASGFLVNFTG
jgi:hypothetical protein